MGLEFDAVSIQTIAAEEDADYPVLPVRDIATMDSARFGVHIDFGVGAAVFPALPMIEYSTFLPDSQVALLGHLIEPEMLRRFHAMRELDVASSRMQNFYDISTFDSSLNCGGITSVCCSRRRLSGAVRSYRQICRPP